MSGVQASVQVNSRMTTVYQNIAESIDVCMGAMQSFSNVSNRAFDVTPLNSASHALADVNSEMAELTTLAAQAAERTEAIQMAARRAATEINVIEEREIQFDIPIIEEPKREESKNKPDNKIGDALQSALGKIINLESIQKIVNLSDEMTQAATRINSMNDGLQTTEELQNQIFKAAEASRGSYLAMSTSVANLGTIAGGAFDSSSEIVGFAEQINKLLLMSGTAAGDTNASMMELAQSMASGALSGSDLSSMMEGGSMIASTIADYMGVSTDKLGELAEQGTITSEVVKNAVLGAAAETDAAFADMPKTWGDLWTSFKNHALLAFEPLLQKINEIANSEKFQEFMANVMNVMALVGEAIGVVFDAIVNVGTFLYDNWNIIGPVIYAVVVAMAAYALVAGIVTIAQNLLNLAMCPMFLIILLIIGAVVGIITALVAFCDHLFNTGSVATTIFGKIMGALCVLGMFMVNLKMTASNVLYGIWEVIKAVVTNIGIAFQNQIFKIQGMWFGLLLTITTVIAGICTLLNKLPFIEIDISGIADKAGEYARKKAYVEGQQKDYVSIKDAWDKGFGHYDTWQEGWAQNAYDQGAAWGDEKWNGLFGGDDDKKKYTTNPLDGLPESAANTAANTGNIAGDTSNIANTLDIDNEELKYLRDIAEREVINRFTTAEIKVEAPISANISNGMDLDGIVDHLTASMDAAMSKAAEGVHY